MSRIYKKKQENLKSSRKNCEMTIDSKGKMRSTVVACCSKPDVKQYGCQNKKTTETKIKLKFQKNDDIISISSSESQETVLRQVEIVGKNQEKKKQKDKNESKHRKNTNHDNKRTMKTPNKKQLEKPLSISLSPISSVESDKSNVIEKERKHSSDDNSTCSSPSRSTPKSARKYRIASRRFKPNLEKRKCNRRCCGNSRKYVNDSRYSSRSDHFRNSNYRNSKFRKSDEYKYYCRPRAISPRYNKYIDRDRSFRDRNSRHIYRRSSYRDRNSYFNYRNLDYKCYKCCRRARRISRSRESSIPRYNRDFDEEYRIQKHISRYMRSKRDRY